MSDDSTEIHYLQDEFIITDELPSRAFHRFYGFNRPEIGPKDLFSEIKTVSSRIQRPYVLIIGSENNQLMDSMCEEINKFTENTFTRYFGQYESIIGWYRTESSIDSVPDEQIKSLLVNKWPTVSLDSNIYVVFHGEFTYGENNELYVIDKNLVVSENSTNDLIKYIFGDEIVEDNCFLYNIINEFNKDFENKNPQKPSNDELDYGDNGDLILINPQENFTLDNFINFIKAHTDTWQVKWDDISPYIRNPKIPDKEFTPTLPVYPIYNGLTGWSDAKDIPWWYNTNTKNIVEIGSI